MGKKLKIVIADDSTELGQNCAKALKGYGMEVLLCTVSLLCYNKYTLERR